MHNPKSGRGDHNKRELVNALADAGHEVIYQSTKQKHYKKALKQSADLVLAAGGDGTVGKVGRQLIDTAIPLAVLPLGTANNLARSLGLMAAPEQIIAGLDNGKRQPFDVGLARGPWGKRYFFESAGAGRLADYLRTRKSKAKKAKKLSKEREMRRHVTRLRSMLKDYPVGDWNIEIDGERISERYILWEAMNIRSVGPTLYLAMQAATTDGRFEFVCVRDEERSVLIGYLEARLTRESTKFPLPFRRCRSLRIIRKNSALHFDSKLWPRNKDKPTNTAEIEITVRPAALVILQPARAAQARQ